jgi:hypothetical protein
VDIGGGRIEGWVGVGVKGDWGNILEMNIWLATRMGRMETWRRRCEEAMGGGYGEEDVDECDDGWGVRLLHCLAAIQRALGNFKRRSCTFCCSS